MVDEYGAGTRTGLPEEEFRFLYGRWIQIARGLAEYSQDGSDSSMVDEYSTWKYSITLSGRVQIPLWSMNTLPLALRLCGLARSDSSMVDEYFHKLARCEAFKQFRFLYGRWIHSSVLFGWVLQHVQIPLWSMNTRTRRLYIWPIREFRFLYGRWIP